MMRCVGLMKVCLPVVKLPVVKLPVVELPLVGCRHGKGNPLPAPVAAYSARGKSNEDEDRDVLRDLTGNGHDISLKNFAFSRESGFNGFVQDFRLWSAVDSIGESHTEDVLDIRIADGGTWRGGCDKERFAWRDFRINVHNGENTGNCSFIVVNNSVTPIDVIFKQRLAEGENVIKLPAEEPEYDYRVYFAIRKLDNSLGGGVLTVSQEPEYLDALVFDGVDDWGVCENLNLGDDYTVIVEREVFRADSNASVLTKRTSIDSEDGEFQFERYGDSDVEVNTYSYGAKTVVARERGGVSWQTRSSYNGLPIASGDMGSSDVLSIGVLRNNSYSSIINMAFRSAYLFDRSLSEKEIGAFVRRHIDSGYLAPSERPKPAVYYDFSGMTNEEKPAVVKNLAGDGLDGTLNNFAYSIASGFGGCAQDFRLWKPMVTGQLVSSSETEFVWQKIDGNNFGLSCALTRYNNVAWKLMNPERRMVGVSLNMGNNVFKGFVAATDSEVIEIQKVTEEGALGVILYFYGELNEPKRFHQLPRFPGALCFDGVDDFLSIAGGRQFGTVMMVNRSNDGGGVIYDQRKPYMKSFALANVNDTDTGNASAYYSRDYANIRCFINNRLNPKDGGLTWDKLIGKKILIAATGTTVEQVFDNTIGASLAGEFCDKMAMWKFLAFDKKLTEREMDWVIREYDLLDGVDDVWEDV